MSNTDNKMIVKILEDARKSRIYLDESGDTESYRARRCVNLLQNVAWLMSRNAQIIKTASNKFGWADHGALGHYINMESL